MTINTAKASSDALIRAARVSIGKLDYPAADGYLREIAKRQEPSAEAAYMMAEVMAARGQKADAIRLAVEAMQLEPGNEAYMARFIDFAGSERVHAFSPNINAAIEACLNHAETLQVWRMATLWVSNLYLRPDFRAAYFGEDKLGKDDDVKNFAPLLTPYFLQGLRHLIVPSPQFEGLFGYLRRHILEDVTEGAKHLSPADHMTLGAALSHYGFSTEFIAGYTSEKEVKAVETLKAKVESGAVSGAEIVALACYMPLYKLSNAQDLIAICEAADEHARGVAQTQIIAWHDLLREAETVESVTEISDGVSGAVRAQYEEFPYPRWDFMPEASIQRGFALQSAEYPVLKEVCGGKFSGLIAGCGTGAEPVAWSLSAPEAKFLAVDLSRMSLAYAKIKAKEHGVTNVDFRHGDLLKLDSLGRKFDLIVCSGVLHHTENPLESWRALTRLLKPNGLMRIALYSKTARRGVLVAQDAARKNGYTGNVESMRVFRRDCLVNLPKPLIDNLMGFKDYYIMSMYRDLLFHVQEANYDLSEISSMLDDLGLKFDGFVIDAPARKAFRKMFPQKGADKNLAAWHAFEQRNPNTFSAMYQFWCRKKG